jgi:hypothetical protein
MAQYRVETCSGWFVVHAEVKQNRPWQKAAAFTNERRSLA